MEFPNLGQRRQTCYGHFRGDEVVCLGGGCSSHEPPRVAKKEPKYWPLVDAHEFERPTGTERKQMKEHYKFITDTNCFHLGLWLRAQSSGKVPDSFVRSSVRWKPGGLLARTHLVGAERQIA